MIQERGSSRYNDESMEEEIHTGGCGPLLRGGEKRRRTEEQPEETRMGWKKERREKEEEEEERKEKREGKGIKKESKGKSI